MPSQQICLAEQPLRSQIIIGSDVDLKNDIYNGSSSDALSEQHLELWRINFYIFSLTHKKFEPISTNIEF